MNVSPFSAHQDVLGPPVPSDEASKHRLLEELKRRGKSAVASGAFLDAGRLYAKALECTQDGKELAILHSNRALCQGKMNMWKESLESATNGVKHDPEYTKAYWRQAQAHAALEEYDSAVSCMKQALNREPSNSALQKELNKYEKLAIEAPKKQEPTNTAKVEVEKVTTTVTKSSGVSTTTTQETKSDAMQVDDEDGIAEGFSKSEVVRGYKVVNGKKTSYFHNELDEKTAQLIGDIAPKKLDEPLTSANGNTNGTSAWNQAGTWEEKDVTQWALGQLQERLTQVSYVLPASSPAPLAKVSTSKVTVTGHASVAMARGKKRYIYEFHVKLEWKFEHDESTAEGKLEFPDVDGTCILGEGYEEANFSVDEASTDTLRPLLQSFVHKQGWRKAMEDAIDDWVRAFKESY